MTDDRLILAKVLFWLELRGQYVYTVGEIAYRMEISIIDAVEAVEVLSREGMIDVLLNGGIKRYSAKVDPDVRIPTEKPDR